MKYVEARTKDGVDLFDRPRRIGFGYGDIRRMQTQFKAPLLGDEMTWKDSLLGRLGNLDFNVLSGFLVVGLNNYTKKTLTQEDVDGLIESYLEGTDARAPGTLLELVTLVRLALETGGFVPTKKEPGTGDDDAEAKRRDPLDNA